MHPRAVLVCLLPAALLWPWDSWAECRFSLATAAAVDGREVRLSDIARPLDGCPDWDRLGRTVLFPAPRQGERPVVVQRGQLADVLLDKLAGQAQPDLPPGELWLQAGGRVLLEAELRTRVVDYLTQATAGLGEVQVRDVRVPECFFMDKTSDTLVIEPTGGVGPGKASLRLSSGQPGDKGYRQAQALAQVDVWADVPCAAKPIQAGEEITPEVVAHRRKNLASIKSPVWLGNLGPSRARRPIGTGQPLTEEVVGPKPVVSRGETVTLVFEGHYLRLEVEARALSEGMAGDTVQVMNLQSQREVLAVVRDRDTVVVR